MHWQRRGPAVVWGLVLLTIAACSKPAPPTLSSPELTDEDQSSVTLAEGPASDDYPVARRTEQVDDYFGTKIADPYRWLEDDNSAETKDWIKSENAITFSFLEKIPERDAIGKRLTELWDYEKYGVPSQRGGRYLYTRNDGLQNQSVLYVAESLDAKPRMLLDPNTLSKEGTTSLTGYDLSDDGKLLAYGLAKAGSDWQEWKVRDIDTGEDRDDHLKWVKFSSASWNKAGTGFYYSRYDEPAKEAELTGVNYFQKLYFHKLGTPQSDDKLVYERKDEKEWGFDGHVTEDGSLLIITVWRGTERKSQVFYLDLQDDDAKVVELITGWDAQYDFVGNDGQKLWFRTDLDAPKYRMLAVELKEPDRKQWKETIPEADAVLESVSLVGDRFFATYLEDAHSVVKLHMLDGNASHELKLPGLGTVGGFTGQRKDTETFYSFTGFTSPTTIYRYDIKANKATVFKQPQLKFDPDKYETRQVFYTSRDGTRIPMFIVGRKGLDLNGQNPTYLYGYGGFNIPLTPAFAPYRIVWLEMGGVFAMPNLRGGGEYGREWHEAGMKLNKQNVFDDFIAAAEYLEREKFTSKPKLAIAGRSNGGLLVGAAMTERPDLFGAALPGVGVLDMLRFQKFTIGWAWVSEYGSSDNEQDFKNLLKYSPLHNIRPETHYPATFIETADHDDRVVPAHSFKFAATLQSNQVGSAPILIRIETSAGHGAGTPTSKLIDEFTDAYAFLVKVLHMSLPEGFALPSSKSVD